MSLHEDRSGIASWIIKYLNKYILCFFLCFSFSATNTYSQKTYTPQYGDPINEPWRWTTFNELAGKGIRCMEESSDGSIWVGINHGVARYNGLEWKEYNASNGFIGSTVFHLTNSDDKVLYAGSDSGLYAFSNNKWFRKFPFTEHPQNEQLQEIRCLKKMKAGGVIASVGTGLYRGLLAIHDSEISFFASKKTIDSLGPLPGINMQLVPDDKCIDQIFCVEEVFQDSQERIWVWTSQGTEEGHIFYFKQSGNNPEFQFSKNFTRTDGLMKGDRAKFGEDGEGNIWMVNNKYDVGISVFNGVSWNYFKLKGENSHLSIININGNIWIGSFGILNLYNNGEWRKYQRPYTAIPASYLIVNKDNNGYLWVIGTQNELVRIDYSGKKWASYQSLNFQCEDNAKNLWFLSVDGKVVVKKGNSWYYYTAVDGLPDAPVKIYCTKKGRICVAGSYKEQASISFLNTNSWKRHIFPELSWGIDYRAVFEDAEGSLWIGASVNYNPGKGQQSGVIKITNPGTTEQSSTHFLPESGIGMYNAYGISQSADGVVWLAGRGLSRFSNGHWGRFTQIPELGDYINCMASTSNGKLWIGSRKSGVFLYNCKEWINFNVENGLKSNTVISLFPINDNDIWIATNRDFSRFDGRSWTTDLLSKDFTLSREGGDIQVQPDGTLWINRSSRDWKRRAINYNIVEKEDADYFSTFSYKADTLKPETRISMYSQEVPSTGSTIIEWEGTDVGRTSPTSQLQFSYRLNDEEWSNFSYKSNITFHHLKTGEYNFEVKARDMDFNIDPSPVQVSFTVLPPVWKQSWFIVLILFFLTVIVAYQYSAFRRKKYLLRLNVQLEKHSDEIEQKNVLLEEQKEQILLQNAQEKERHQGRIRFFTNISHEFRTPLTLIAGVIDDLSEKPVSGVPSFIQKQLATLKRNTNQLLRLINQLMDFRKLENNSMSLKISETDIVGFTRDVSNLFSEFAEKHNVSLKFTSEIKEKQAWFDQGKIERVLYNLISNAIKFSTEAGTVFIKLQSGKAGKADDVVILIEDTGIGIAEEDLNNIFEPFYQVKNTDGSKYYGTGIGLSIVNNLVKLHRGKLELVSSSDKKIQLERGFSTRFSISLPLNKSTYNENEILSSKAIPYSLENSIYIEDEIEFENINESLKEMELPSKRSVPLILVLEDNDDLRRHIVDTLSNHYKIVEADNGSDGFDMVVKLMPDLIISDIMMPKMSGTELCEKLKKDLRTSHIPVVLLTARTTDENRIEGYQIGVDDYITKPFNMSLLIARINNILAMHASLKRKFKNEDITQPDEVKVSSIDEQFLQKVKTIVENNFSNHLFGVEELSKEMGISGRHLLFRLQSLIDMTPVEYIRVFRLKRAAQLLVSKKASISDIVYETGFNDISYFGKCFTKYFGMNPSKYIKMYYKKGDISKPQN